MKPNPNSGSNRDDDDDDVFVCCDCGNSIENQWYLVHDHVWHSAFLNKPAGKFATYPKPGDPGGTFLCVDCLEKRLGRQLTRRDFQEIPMNYYIGSFRRFVPKLRERMLSRSASRSRSAGRLYGGLRIPQSGDTYSILTVEEAANTPNFHKWFVTSDNLMVAVDDHEGAAKEILERARLAPSRWSTSWLDQGVCLLQGYGWIRAVRIDAEEMSVNQGVSESQKATLKDFGVRTGIMMVEQGSGIAGIPFFKPIREAAISPEIARGLSMETAMPDHERFEQAVQNTAGTKITPDGLEIEIMRNQHPNQPGQWSIRSGVFYQPVGTANPFSFRKEYGGEQSIRGKTLLRRPFFIKGGVGGRGVERAYEEVLGKGAFDQLRKAVMDNLLFGSWYNHGFLTPEKIADFLRDFGGDPRSARDIFWLHKNSKTNHLMTAVCENVIAHTLRSAGYDSILCYSLRRDGRPFFSEVFDLREATYPGPESGGNLHPWFQRQVQASQQDSKFVDLVKQYEPLVGDDDDAAWEVVLDGRSYRLLFERWGYGCVERSLGLGLIPTPDLDGEWFGKLEAEDLTGPNAESAWEFVDEEEKKECYQQELKRRGFQPVQQIWKTEQKYDYDMVSWLLLASAG